MKEKLLAVGHSVRTWRGIASRGKLFRILGHGILRRFRAHEMFLPDLTDDDLAIIGACKPYTMTSPDRMYGLISAVRYIVANEIPGDFVECGVWKGGSAMVMIKTLQLLGATNRHVYLFDTYTGMTAPTEKDKSLFEAADPRPAYEALKQQNEICQWSYASLDEVRRTVLSTGYDEKKIHFVVGPVEQTLPGKAPEQIALLRLDTDFYESTKAEMIHLYPRLVSGGPIIIDDYGHWEGARMAVDEYLAEHKVKLLLTRLDYSGRMGVKL